MDHVKSSKSCLLTKHCCLLQSFRIPSLLMRMAAWSHNYLRCPASSLCDPSHWPLALEPLARSRCRVSRPCVRVLGSHLTVWPPGWCRVQLTFHMLSFTTSHRTLSTEYRDITVSACRQCNWRHSVCVFGKLLTIGRCLAVCRNPGHCCFPEISPFEWWSVNTMLGPL